MARFQPRAWGEIQKWDLILPCPKGEEVAGAGILVDVIECCVRLGMLLHNIATALLPEGSPDTDNA